MKVCGQDTHITSLYPLRDPNETTFSLVFKISAVVLGVLSLLAALALLTGIIPANGLNNGLGFTTLALGVLSVIIGLCTRCTKGAETNDEPQSFGSKGITAYSGESDPDKIIEHYSEKIAPFPNKTYVTHTAQGQIYYIYKDEQGRVHSLVEECGAGPSEATKSEVDRIKTYTLINQKYGE